MASVPEKPIAAWLRSSRLGQSMPSGDPWTYDYLFRQMRQAIGWAPPHPNYSRYENGKSTPSRETLAKLVGFWAALGVDGPDLTPPTAGEVGTTDSPAALIRALEAQTAAISELVALVRANEDDREARLRGLEAAVALLARPSVEAPQGLPAPHGSGR